MNRRHRTRTVVAALSLALQAFAWAFAPLADARLEHAAERAAVHVEADAGAACTPGHDHVTCALCNYAGARWVASTARAQPLLRPAAVVAAGRLGVDAPSTASRSLNASRAPPHS